MGRKKLSSAFFLPFFKPPGVESERHSPFLPPAWPPCPLAPRYVQVHRLENAKSFETIEAEIAAREEAPFLVATAAGGVLPPRHAHTGAPEGAAPGSSERATQLAAR